MGDSEPHEEGIVYVNLKSYLEEQEQRERARPEGLRRPVPKLEDIARALDMTPEGLSKIVNNRTLLLNRHTLAAMLDELRRWGFPADVGDILVYRPTNGEHRS